MHEIRGVVCALLDVQSLMWSQHSVQPPLEHLVICLFLTFLLVNEHTKAQCRGIIFFAAVLLALRIDRIHGMRDVICALVRCDSYLAAQHSVPGAPRHCLFLFFFFCLFHMGDQAPGPNINCSSPSCAHVTVALLCS